MALKHRRASALTLPALCVSVLEKENIFPSDERSEGVGNESSSVRTKERPEQSVFFF